jgi:hypothetical protein
LKATGMGRLAWWQAATAPTVPQPDSRQSI